MPAIRKFDPALLPDVERRWQTGETLNVIAASLGVTPVTIRRARHFRSKPRAPTKPPEAKLPRGRRPGYHGRLPVAELRRLHARGWSAARIATAIGHPRNSVAYAVQRLGMGPWRPVRPWTIAESERLAELWASGVPLRLIAQRLGRTIAQASGRRKRLGLPRRGPSPRMFSAAESAFIEVNWSRLRLKEIAARLGRDTSSISGHALRKLGLPRRAPAGRGSRMAEATVP